MKCPNCYTKMKLFPKKKLKKIVPCIKREIGRSTKGHSPIITFIKGEKKIYSGKTKIIWKCPRCNKVIR